MSYDYDGCGLLTEAKVPDPGLDYKYTYDAGANMKTEKTGTGETGDTSSSTTYFGYDKAGQRCWRGAATGAQLVDGTCANATTPTGNTTINRDAAGNSLGAAATPLTYNPANQVASIDGRDQGYHDLGNDLRVSTGPSSAGGARLLNSRTGVLARRYVDGGATKTTYYVRHPEGRILASYGPDGTLYYVSNTQDSVTTLIQQTASWAPTTATPPTENPPSSPTPPELEHATRGAMSAATTTSKATATPSSAPATTTTKAPSTKPTLSRGASTTLSPHSPTPTAVQTPSIARIRAGALGVGISSIQSVRGMAGMK